IPAAAAAACLRFSVAISRSSQCRPPDRMNMIPQSANSAYAPRPLGAFASGPGTTVRLIGNFFSPLTTNTPAGSKLILAGFLRGAAAWAPQRKLVATRARRQQLRGAKLMSVSQLKRVAADIMPGIFRQTVQHVNKSESACSPVPMRLLSLIAPQPTQFQ